MGLFDGNSTTSFTENYEFGFPDIKGNKPVKISFSFKKVEFKILSIFESTKVTFEPDDILEVGLNQESYRSSGKAATGAIVGGLLTGGIGLIAGAAMGGKRRKENQLTLVVDYFGNPCDILISPSKNTVSIYNEFKKLIQLQTPKKQNQIVESSVQKIDLVTELERLHSLFEKGILTKEEFETQKKKILS